MKKQILLILLTAFCCKSYCQAPNTDILVISPSKLNIVYVALLNPITIAVAGLPAEKVLVTTDGGTLTGEKGKYLLSIPDTSTQKLKEVKLTIYEIIKPGKQKEIGTRIYRVKMIPKPLASISNDNSCNPKDYIDGEIYIKDLKSLDKVNVKIQDFPFHVLDYTVKKYRLVCATKTNTTVLSGEGSKLTPEMKTALNNLKQGDVIIITDIYASFPSSNDKRLPGAITLTVKK